MYTPADVTLTRYQTSKHLSIATLYSWNKKKKKESELLVVDKERLDGILNLQYPRRNQPVA